MSENSNPPRKKLPAYTVVVSVSVLENGETLYGDSARQPFPPPRPGSIFRSQSLTQGLRAFDASMRSVMDQLLNPSTEEKGS